MRAINPEIAKIFTTFGIKKEVKRNTIIDVDKEHMIVCAAGTIGVNYLIGSDGEALQVDKIGPGQIVSPEVMLGHSPQIEMRVGKGVSYWKVSTKTFKKYFSHCSQEAQNSFYLQLADRLKWSDEIRVSQKKNTAPTYVMRTVLRAFAVDDELQTSEIGVRSLITRDEIANMLGMSRENASRAIIRLKDLGVIATDSDKTNSFHVVRPNK